MITVFIYGVVYMILRVYCIFDKKGLNFGPPVCAMNDALAKRYFQELCSSNGSIYSKYPEDFDLYEIGFYDEDTAKLTSHESNLFITNATEFFQKSVDPNVSSG